jgi:hypothetical protein
MENQNFGFVIINTSKNPIVETKNLNFLSAELAKTKWFKNFVDMDRTGFSINPSDAKWEYEIQFKQKSRFIVFRELDRTTLRCWFYSHSNDLKPIIMDMRDYVNHQYCVKVTLEMIQSFYNGK